MSKVKAKTKGEKRSALVSAAGVRLGKAALTAIAPDSVAPEIKEALSQLISARNKLREAHKAHIGLVGHRRPPKEMTFALDGRLVGDIGELIAAQVFSLELRQTKRTDAVATVGTKHKIQIKATFSQKSLSISHAGNHFIGLLLDESGTYRVIYNGPARYVAQYLGLPARTGAKSKVLDGSQLTPLALSTWALLNSSVKSGERISRRPTLSKGTVAK